jgi:hypothetical protein
MSAPIMNPTDRHTADLLSPDEYGPGTGVWVFCGGSWRPGIVIGCSPQAASVRYRPTSSRGTAVDTVMARNLARRMEADAVDEFAHTAPDGLHRRTPSR